MRIVERFTTTAPARVVWSTLQEIAEWPKWTSTVTRIESLDFAGLRMGARFCVYQPKLRPTIYVVTVLRPGESFAWTAKMPGATMVGDHKVSIAGDTTDV